jgi:hypothetical protein
MANFPRRKLSKPLDQFAFPNDLLSNPNRPRVTIQFANYQNAFYGGGNRLGTAIAGAAGGLVNQFGSFINNLTGGDSTTNISQILNPVGSIILPMPRKINENQELMWNETSLFDMLSLPKEFEVPSALTGFQINPFQLLYFQRPAFKQFSFSWTLTPNTPEESETLRKIVIEFKRRSLPKIRGPLFEYPDIALVKFSNNINDQLILKACAIISVQIDHSGTNVPSFFKNSRTAPVAVNMTVQMKEIDIWAQNDYDPTLGNFGLGSVIDRISTSIRNATSQNGNE